MAGEFVNPKNMTVGSKDPSGVVKAAFYSSPSFIFTLLYSYFRFIFINIFLVSRFSIMSEISDNG